MAGLRSPALFSNLEEEGGATTHTPYTYKASKINAGAFQGREGR
jgi:hypothetical protein